MARASCDEPPSGQRLSHIEALRGGVESDTDAAEYHLTSEPEVPGGAKRSAIGSRDVEGVGEGVLVTCCDGVLEVVWLAVSEVDGVPEIDVVWL